MPEVQHQDKASFNTNVNPFTEDKLNFARQKARQGDGFLSLNTQGKAWWMVPSPSLIGGQESSHKARHLAVLMLGYKCIWTLSQTSFWWQIYCRKLTLLTFELRWLVHEDKPEGAWCWWCRCWCRSLQGGGSAGRVGGSTQGKLRFASQNKLSAS